MSLYRKVRAVEKVFGQLEKEVATFQKATGMHCVSGCGFCCRKPDINATPLEFLPLAWHLHMEGTSLEFYDSLKNESGTSLCALFRPFENSDTGGKCSNYSGRGLICRLFGFTAARNKHGEARLVTCRIIKENQIGEYNRALDLLNTKKVVFMRDYYFKLSCIDPELGRTMMPVNEAIKSALEVVMAYYAYRRTRKSA